MSSFCCFAIVAASAWLGCYTGPHLDSTSSGAPTTTPANGNVPTASNPMPCDVAEVLGKYCVSYHGSELKGGAKNTMMSSADFDEPSLDLPPVKHAVLALAVLAMLSLVACTHVKPYERGKLAHPTMVTGPMSGPAQEHMHAVHEGARGGSGTAESGCGCN